MKVKPTTIGLVVVAILLGGITLLTVQTTEPRSEQTSTDESQELFAFIESEVQSLRLETQADLFEFERTEEGWQMVTPETTPASDASIAFLLDQMATARSSRSVTIPAEDRADFGLNEPLATVLVTLNDETTHELVLGSYDFNRTSLYALTDPPDSLDEAEELTVHLVSPNFENAVGRPYEEWKQPVAIEPSEPTPESPSPTPDSTEPAEPAE
ncbi:hypothetical protein C7B61_06115 [filamentous cyanobacterium CCP1]|nr:hypothetical protein C7B76_11650 [filamentous cyanobacterium CCP2]PSB67447.1 hypothetical protein C7B61_06115 [filamentous cyanobacterium CCP1]